MTFDSSSTIETADVLLTPSEAGRILGITPEAVRALNNKGHLPALKTLGGRRLFRRSDVDRLAEERAARASDKARAYALAHPQDVEVEPASAATAGIASDAVARDGGGRREDDH